MQDRRGFFASIAGLFAVAAVNPVKALDLESSFYSSRPDVDLAMIPETVKSQMVRLTEFMHAELVKQIGHFPESGGESKICFEYPHLFGIDFMPSMDSFNTLTDEQMKARYVMPAMTNMANEIRFQKATRFAQLPLPSISLADGVRVTGHGVSLRGLRAYDMGSGYEDSWGNYIAGTPGYICRFDVLFG